MTIVGYFCSGGYTETGGMAQFLQRINPELKWKRCFPAVDKPNLKQGRMRATPIGAASGVSGESLVNRMLNILNEPVFEHNDHYDLILLIDDLDCRFNNNTELCSDWMLNTFNRVEQALGRHVQFEALFASPEIETWFIADWANGFGKEYRDIEVLLRREITTLLGACHNSPEDYGGPLFNGSCTIKISAEIQKIITNLSLPNHIYRYSKRENGPAMLNRIDPEQVSSICNRYFRLVYMRLRNLE